MDKPRLRLLTRTSDYDRWVLNGKHVILVKNRFGWKSYFEELFYYVVKTTPRDSKEREELLEWITPKSK